ncbi:F420-dependent protein [Cellulomonas sp. Root137]|nr:F420-dependent protein [Cellulomonas sp. Root137]KRD44565.1 F420-dependent protein [Cellulomonas sp. Root930]
MPTACHRGARLDRVDPEECRRRFGAAERAVLATTGEDQRPHLVPVTFAVLDDVVVVTVDHKPKRTVDLRRLRNIRENPSVAFLVDHWSADWSNLWWVRVDATATVADEPPTPAELLALQARYPAYREVAPGGPLIRARVTRWTGWSAART